MPRRVVWVLGVLVVAVVAAGIPAAVMWQSSKFTPIAEMRQAKSSGHRVEVVSGRTQTETLYANPNGSFTRTYSPVPVRVKTAAGWRKIDDTLVVGADGLVRPKAAPDDVVLSGGGSTPMVSVTMQRVRTAMTWPGKLPKPSLDGATATYASVLPGVDLKVTVGDGGPSQVLVVHDRQAALNPALAKIKLATKVTGGSIGESDGGLRVLDKRGREVARAAQPQMWDSAGQAIDVRRGVLTGKKAEAARLAGPQPKDHVAPVKLTVAKGTVTLKPDAALMADPSTSWPLFVDPMVDAPEYDWAMVRKEQPSTIFYKWSDYGQYVGNYQDIVTQRLFYKFDLSDLAGTMVNKATFSTRLLKTDSCSDAPSITVERTNQITPSTTWSSQPATIGDPLDTRSNVAGHDDCKGSPLLEFGTTDAVQAAINADTGSNPVTKITLRVEDSDEDDGDAWMGLPQATTLSVDFYTPPAVPTQLSVNDPDRVCSTTSGGITIGGVKPRIQATLLDVDGDNVQMEAQAFAGTAIPTDGTPPIWTEDIDGSSAAAATTGGSPGNTFVSATRIQYADGSLPNGAYVWRVRSVKGSVVTHTSAWSDPCKILVTTTATTTPVIVDPGASTWAVDKTMSVTIKPIASGTVPASTASYEWSLNSTAPQHLAAIDASSTTKQVSIGVTPTHSGTNTLRVWAYDVAGNRSPAAALTFDTNANAGAFKDRYLLDEGSGTTSADLSGSNNLTIPSGVWADRGVYRTSETGVQPHDFYLHFSGTQTTPALSASPAITNTANYTISAWLKPVGGSTSMVALSQGTSTVSQITLGVTNCSTTTTTPQTTTCAYQLGIRNSGGTYDYTTSAPVSSSITGALTHVVATVSGSGRARLYVFTGGRMDVTTNSTVTVPGTASTGPLILGADKQTSGYTSKWAGYIDDVSILNGALDPAGVMQLHALDDSRCYISHTSDDIEGTNACIN